MECADEVENGDGPADLDGPREGEGPRDGEAQGEAPLGEEGDDSATLIPVKAFW